jgi:S1-C subfamily serine protease
MFAVPNPRLTFAALALSLALHCNAALPQSVGETPMPSLAPMVKKVSPAVVNIATRGYNQHGTLVIEYTRTILVWKRDHNRKVTAETASVAESKLETERETWEKSNAELHETVAKLRVEITQQNESREQEKASFQNQLTASQQQFEDARALVAAAQEQLATVQEQLAE